MKSTAAKAIRKLNYLKNDVLFFSGLKQHKLGRNPFRRIIIYHGVVPEARKNINARFISTSEFARHLQFYKAHFEVVPLEQYFEAGNSATSKPVVALTFDDGYQNNFSEVLPLLEEFKLPATFFVTTIRKAGYNILWADALDLFWYTGPEQLRFINIQYRKGRHEFISEKGPLKQHLKNSDRALKNNFVDLVLNNNLFLNENKYAPYWHLMNEEEINVLSASAYAEVGSHGLYHNCLTKIPIADARQELMESKKYLEQITGKPVNYFAYPDGDFNDELVQEARKAGYHGQLLADYHQPANARTGDLAERFGINPYISVKNQMQCIINGRY